MSKTYSAGIVTAYGAAKRAGYQGTYEDFCRQQAGYAESAATVEQAKNTAVSAASTATAKAGEAATAATAAQTAKTQTEAAASQALTDISSARSSAISAIQTEGATQTANARAQAQAAATSATTAITKASEASASATSAGQSATNAAASATSAANAASAAQAVLNSIPEGYSDLSEDVGQLKADLLSYQKNVGAEIDFVGTASVANQNVTIGHFSIIQGHKYDVIASVASGLEYGVYVYLKKNGTTITQINLPQGTSKGSKTFTADGDGVVDVMFRQTSSVSTVCNVSVSDQNGKIIATENLSKQNEIKIGAFNGITYNLPFEQGAIGGNGTPYNSNNEIRTGMILVPPSRYRVSVNGYRVYVLFYNENGTLQSDKNIWAKTSDFTFNVTDENLYVRFSCNKVSGEAITPVDNAITLTNQGIYDEFVKARGEYHTLDDRLDVIEKSTAIPSYFTDEYLKSKLDEICDNSVIDSGALFAFITDVHLEANSGSSKFLMRYFLDSAPISFVMFGGDVPSAYSSISGNEKAEVIKDAQEWLEWINYWGVYRVYQMRGNHDYVKSYQSDPTKYYNMSNGGVHQFVSNKFADKVHVNEANKNYYYFDNEVQKIRYIVLDGHTYNSNYPTVVVSWITLTQINWLIDVLNNSDGYNIVILSHEACDPSLSSYSPNLAIVQTIAEAFANRGTVSTVASGGIVSADFTNSTGELICVLSGHSHKDESHVSNNVLSISTTCDAYYNNDPDVTRTQGTISESAFDIFCIDTTNRTIKTVRIGAGLNREWIY